MSRIALVCGGQPEVSQVVWGACTAHGLTSGGSLLGELRGLCLSDRLPLCGNEILPVFLSPETPLRDAPPCSNLLDLSRAQGFAGTEYHLNDIPEV